MCNPSRHTWRQFTNLKSTMVVARAKSHGLSVPSSRQVGAPCGPQPRKRQRSSSAGDPRAEKRFQSPRQFAAILRERTKSTLAPWVTRVIDQRNRVGRELDRPFPPCGCIPMSRISCSGASKSSRAAACITFLPETVSDADVALESSKLDSSIMHCGR